MHGGGRGKNVSSPPLQTQKKNTRKRNRIDAFTDTIEYLYYAV